MNCGETLVCTIRDILPGRLWENCYETISGWCLASLIYSLSILIGICYGRIGILESSRIEH